MFQMLFMLFIIYYFYFTVKTQILNILQFPYNYVKNNKDLIQSFNSKLLQTQLSVNNYKTWLWLYRCWADADDPQVQYLSPGHCAHNGPILSCHHRQPPASGRCVYMSHPLLLGTEAHKKHQVIFHSLYYIYIYIHANLLLSQLTPCFHPNSPLIQLTSCFHPNSPLS